MTSRMLVRGLACVLLSAVPAMAQTGPELLLKPWEDGQSFDFEVDTQFQAQGNTEVRAGGGGGADFHLQRYEFSGRLRLDGPFRAPAGREAQPAAEGGLNIRNLTIGGELDYLNFDTIDPLIPERLVDMEFGIGATLCKCGDWEVAAVVGLGYAGNNPFADAEALYAMADIMFIRKLDEQSTLQLGINFHGNRNLFPDLPIPTISYTRKQSDQFWWTVGIPISNLHWEPVERLTIDLFYLPLYTIDATVQYKPLEWLAVFGSFKNRFNAYTVDKDIDNRRVFFEQRRLEAGVEVFPSKHFSVILAVGYAFDQEFSRGWDARDNDTIAEVSDEPYIRAGLEVEF